jgi:glucose/arabinose dehydrogenase
MDRPAINTGNDMRRKLGTIVVLILVTIIASCGRDADVTTGASVDTSGGGSTQVESEGMSLRVEDLARTGQVIWAMDFIDGETMIFTERAGKIKTLALDSGEIREIAGGPDVYAVESGGLFDVLVDPEFATNQRLYWTYIKKVGANSVTAVARGRLQDGRIDELEDLFVANNASPDHAHWGSRIVMGPDRSLYFTVGERHVPDNAQDLKSHGGKVLRLNEDGGVPADNPFVGQPDAMPEIWSYGHRNPQGLAFHPQTGLLIEQEHGPTGGDEINIIKKGANYGWPLVTYGTNIWGGQEAAGTARLGTEQPIVFFDPGIAPSGMSIYDADRFSAWRGNIFSSTLRGHLNRVVLDGRKVTHEERLLSDWTERVRDVAEGPDGYIYLATETGRIARIVPVQ